MFKFFGKLNKDMLRSSYLLVKNLSSAPKKVSQENLCAVLYKANDLRLEQRPIPRPKDNEVLLQMGCVGICGSDRHYLEHGRIGNFVVKEPMVLGHEASGVVAKVGKCVQNLVKGDRVAIEPQVPCRKCEYCKAGKYHLCPNIYFCATPPDDGNLCRYFCHAADFCYKLPDHVSLEEGALMEPLSVAVHACRLANIELGSRVLILGAGPVGLCTVVIAKAMGAGPVLILDLVQNRLDVAEKLGADMFLLLQPDDCEEDVVIKIKDLMCGFPEKSIECSGATSAIRLSVLATKPGGCSVIVGNGQTDPEVPILDATSREISIKGSFRYANDYPAALQVVSTTDVDLKCLITHNFTLEQTIQAFETAKSGKENTIKIIIHPLEKSN